MSAKVNVKTAVAHIEAAGILLVYPIHNRKEPASLWSRFFPRSPMKWEWDTDGDDRVGDIWHLRMELSRSNQVVYSKWYQGRATFFSRQIFTALLRCTTELRLSPQAAEILQLLQEDSPLSTKEIKQATDLRGRSLEPLYQRAMKELWAQLLIVGYGEKEDGAFPSLAIGASEMLFEDLCMEARSMARAKAEKILEDTLGTTLFIRYHRRLNEREST